MTQIVLSGIGQAVAGPIGGLVGNVLGGAADKTFINSLSPVRQAGRRITGLQLNQASQGDPIKQVFGRARVAGTIIWAARLKENRSTTRASKTSPKTETYSYSLSFAVALCEGPIGGIGRVWADGQLIDLSRIGYARSTGDVVIFCDSDDLLHPDIAREIAAVWTPMLSKVQFQMARIDGDGQPTGSVFPDFDPLPSPGRIRDWMLDAGAYPTPPSSGNAYARAFLDRIFPLTKECDDFSDSYLLAAAPLLGDVVTVAKPMAMYRIHGNNDSNLLAKPGRFAREVDRALLTFRYSQRIGREAGIAIPDEALRRNLHVIQHRIPSVKLTPEAHPLAGDSVWRVLGDMVRTSLSFGAMSVKNRLVLGVWGALTLLAPMPVARKLIALRFAR
jgi:hypothetical protein